jgi:hypothetical protein
MLYLLQVDVIVAVAILLPFFAAYLALVALRLGYHAAIRFAHMGEGPLSEIRGYIRTLDGHANQRTLMNDLKVSP